MNSSCINLELPNEILLSLKETTVSFEKKILLLAALKLYETGKLSSGLASKMAGMSRIQFLLNLYEYKISPFQVDKDDIESEINNARI
jgi:predicted HTH domain antitoxin